MTNFGLALAYTAGYILVAQSQISPNWVVDLRTVAAVGGVVICGCWYIRGWMVKIDARLDVNEKRFDSLEQRMNHRDVRLDRIERILDSLPRGGTDFIKKV